MKAVVLLSGGIDSTVMLAQSLSSGRSCFALSFDYGQRHKVELKSAGKIARYYQVPHKIIKIDPQTFSNSALVSGMEMSKNRTCDQIANDGIPNTYVPARNTLFLSYAIGQAEILDAGEIYIGCNKDDRLPYPDCRPEFISAFQSLIDVATKQSVTQTPPKLIAPLIDLNKKEIVQLGKKLKAPLDLTFSCYSPDVNENPCLECDACVIRESGMLYEFHQPGK